MADDSQSVIPPVHQGESDITQLVDVTTSEGGTEHLDDSSISTQLGDRNIGETGHQDNLSSTTQSSDASNRETGHQDKQSATTQLRGSQTNDNFRITRQSSKAGPYIIPQKQPDACKLNPLADPFVPATKTPTQPRRSNRKRMKPVWQLSDNWRLR